MPLLSIGLSGFNIYLEVGPILSDVGAETFFILLEDGAYLLQEDSSRFLLEVAP